MNYPPLYSGYWPCGKTNGYTAQVGRSSTRIHSYGSQGGLGQNSLCASRLLVGAQRWLPFPTELGSSVEDGHDAEHE